MVLDSYFGELFGVSDLFQGVVVEPSVNRPGGQLPHPLERVVEPDIVLVPLGVGVATKTRGKLR